MNSKIYSESVSLLRL